MPRVKVIYLRRLTVAERPLWRQLWGLLEVGDVILADRGFCIYADY